MIAKVLRGSRKAPTALEVKRLESYLGCSINSLFLRFLEINNGGIPRQETYRDTLRTFFVQNVFPLTDDVEPNILQQTKLFDLPRFHAHIGIIGAGDLLLLDADGGSISGMFKGELEYLADDMMEFVGRLEGTMTPEGDRAQQISQSGDIDLLRRFLAEGNDINAVSSTGRTIIQMAAVKGDLRMVKACYEQGAAIDGVAEALRRVAGFKFLETLRAEGILP